MRIPVDAKMFVDDVAKSASSIFPTIPSGLRPGSLTMWKLTEPFPLDLDDLIPGHVKNSRLQSVGFGSGSNPKALAIKSARAISLARYFEFESLSQEHVNVVIQLPEEYSFMVVRRMQEVIAPTNELLAPMKKFSRKSQYTNDTPSRLVVASTCFVNQNNVEERILNDRPAKDAEVVPIALLYSPFGQFLDRMRDSPEESNGITASGCCA